MVLVNFQRMQLVFNINMAFLTSGEFFNFFLFLLGGVQVRNGLRDVVLEVFEFLGNFFLFGGNFFKELFLGLVGGGVLHGEGFGEIGFFGERF